MDSGDRNSPGTALAAASEHRLVARFCTFVAWAVLAGLVAATLAAELRLLRGSTIAPFYPMTIYEPLATPGTATSPGDAGAAGADFSQVYTSASALRHHESAYKPRSKRFLDHWGRPPGYPPLMNWVAVPISLLRYDRALLLYTLLGAGSMFAATAFALWRGGVRRHIGRVLAAQAALYLLTPIGITHLERGQFDVLVAAASALTVGSVFAPGAAFGTALVCGFLGALKWTSVAFLGCFAALGFLLAPGGKRWAFFALPLIIAAGTFPFWTELRDYWTTIRVYEIDASPFGLTFQYFLPRSIARAVPVAATLLIAGLALYRARSAEQRMAALIDVAAPFSVALMNAAVCFGTLSYEYHTVATLGVIPGVVLWVERATGVSKAMKTTACVALGLFLVVAFRTYPVGSLLSPEAMTAVYAAFALLFLAMSALIASRRRA